MAPGAINLQPRPWKWRICGTSVIRNGLPLPVDFQRLLEQGDMSQNIYLRPDDFVYIPVQARPGDLFVWGCSHAPVFLPSETPTTVAAITSGGGPVRGRLFIARWQLFAASLTKPEIAVVNFNDILGKVAPVTFPGEAA